MTTENAPFDASKLTDGELTACIYELRNRGAAVAVYDVAEILTMTDGWLNQPTKEQIEAWFDRDHIEEVMCDAARDEVVDFIDNTLDAAA